MIKDKYHRDWVEKAKREGRCLKCGKPKEDERQDKTMCKACAKRHSSYSKKRADRFKKEGLCTLCGHENDRASEGKSLCGYCSQRYQRQREKLFTLMGSKCSCCGEYRREFLTVDHINGGGNKLRKSSASYSRLLTGRLLSGKETMENFRLLCMNCNTSLGFYGYCPHEQLLEDLE